MNIINKIKRPGYRAQAIVEFAIVMPVLMMILVGIFEVGRMIYIYSAVTNASREAARYGSAVGKDSAYTGSPQKYRNCRGIRDMARRSAYFMNLPDSSIEIKYDHGTVASTFATCTASSGEDSTVIVSNCSANSPCDRVRVTVTATYQPLVRLIPIGSKPITSRSARTILGIFDLGS